MSPAAHHRTTPGRGREVWAMSRSRPADRSTLEPARDPAGRGEWAAPRNPQSPSCGEPAPVSPAVCGCAPSAPHPVAAPTRRNGPHKSHPAPHPWHTLLPTMGAEFPQGNLPPEVFRHLRASQCPAHPVVSPLPALDRAAGAPGGSHVLVQILLRRREQLLPLVRLLLGQQRVAAHNRPFARDGSRAQSRPDGPYPTATSAASQRGPASGSAVRAGRCSSPALPPVAGLRHSASA